MWILVAEAMGALSLFIFIVWWTLGPTQRREREDLRRLANEAAEEAARADVLEAADRAQAAATEH